MPRLLLVALGQLNGTVLEHVARRGVFDDIVVATRSTVTARAKANNVRIGAGIEGRFPSIQVVQFDLNAPTAAAHLRAIAPDVTLAAPSMLPWWQLAALPPAARAIADEAPFATFLPCHLAPMLAFRAAWVASGLTSPWLGSAYPDVVNHILACTGEAPICGTGNVLEAVPKAQLAVAARLGARPEEVAIRLVAQHAFEYFLYGDETTPALRRPPYLLEACWRGRDVAPEVADDLFAAYPIPYGPDFNHLTASATVPVLEALLDQTAVRTHVPAPGGRLGGYPVTLSCQGAALDLAPGWTEARALAVNRESLPYDGIAEIDASGIVTFTDAAAASLRALTGRPVSTLRPRDANRLAMEILAAVAGAPPGDH